MVRTFAEAPVCETLILLILFLSSYQIGGPPVVVAMLGLTGLLIAYMAIFKPVDLVGTLKYWPILILPLFAITSTLWSLDPPVSLRYGVQLIITAIVGLLVTRSIGPRKFVALLYVAVAANCLASVFSQRYGPAQQGVVLIGLSGSKNEMAYLAQLAIITGLTVLFDRGQPNALRLSTLFFIPLGAAIVAFGQAAGALLTAIGSAGILLALFTLHLFKLSGRLVIILAMTVVILPAFAARDEIVDLAEYVLQDVLKKDMTLTGRTYLWERADELIKERPVLGHGYRAIIVGDTIEGLGIKRWAGVEDRRAFHFHSTYREMAVDLGYIGMAIFCGLLFLPLIAMIRIVIFYPSPPFALFLSCLLVVVARSPVELVVGAFSTGAIMLFSIAAWGFSRPKESLTWIPRPRRFVGNVMQREQQFRIDAPPIRLNAPTRETLRPRPKRR